MENKKLSKKEMVKIMSRMPYWQTFYNYNLLSLLSCGRISQKICNEITKKGLLEYKKFGKIL